MIIATAIVVSAFNMYLARHLPWIEGVFATVHVFAFVPIVVTVWVLVSPKTPSAEVFINFSDHARGWPNAALSILVGQITSMFTTIGSDSVAHLADEVDSAATVVPQGMLWSFLLNIPMTIIMLLTFCFNIGSVETALSYPYPFIYVFHHALGSRQATTAFAGIIIVLLVMITVSALAATSRQMYTFACDNGLPFSAWLSCVADHLKVPINAIVLSAICTSLLALLNLGTTAAFNTVLSLSTAALMATYLLSIACVMLRRVRAKGKLPRARWSLGKAGMPVNCVAVVYAAWAFFWALWPEQYAVTAGDFNWAVVILAALMGAAMMLYAAKARKIYNGPTGVIGVLVEDWD